jgi:phage tail P2-like protein
MNNKASLLPDNRTTLKTALEHTLVNHLQNIPSPYPDLWSPDDISTDLLSYLALAKGVQDWDEQDNEQAKRQTVKTIWPVQRTAGTLGAIRQAVESLDLGAEVVPGYQDDGTPYHLLVKFRSNQNFTGNDVTARVAERVKTAISERDTFSLRFSIPVYSNLYNGWGMHIRHRSVIKPQ